LKSGIYGPRLYGLATVHFADRRRKVDETRRAAFLVRLEAGMRSVDWDSAWATDVMADRLLTEPPVAAPYLPLPNGAMKVQTFTRWAQHFDRWLARTQRLQVEEKATAAAGSTPADTASGVVSLRPKRGGISVELVAIAWELVPSA
jgi:hypothetical protein